jgi:hypothetical protein
MPPADDLRMTADAQLICDSSAVTAFANISNETNRLIGVAADNADDADGSGQSTAGAICAQCGAGPSTEPRGDVPTIRIMNERAEVWLHAGGCHRFWRKAHPQ